MKKTKIHISPIRKATGDNELLSAGVNINIPNSTWIGLGLALGLPGIAIMLLWIFKDFVNK